MSAPTPVMIDLIAWARGSYTHEAAVRLLNRSFGGRFAEPGWPWIVYDNQACTYWVDWDRIPEEAGTLSGGERRVLMVAASLGAGTPVALTDVVTGLDRPHLALVLAALSHANGSHEHVEFVPEVVDGVQVVTATTPRLTLGPVFPWDPQGP